MQKRGFGVVASMAMLHSCDHKIVAPACSPACSAAFSDICCPSYAVFRSPHHIRNGDRGSTCVVSVPSKRAALRRRDVLGVCAVEKASGRGDVVQDDIRDDAGVIKDMELYLDNLSLEYDNVWDTKPAWCQPWTIIASGLGVMSMSWFLFHNAIVTGGATFGIGLWWFSFLYAYPMAYSEMISHRRKMMKEGSEDTYGRKRTSSTSSE